MIRSRFLATHAAIAPMRSPARIAPMAIGRVALPAGLVAATEGSACGGSSAMSTSGTCGVRTPVARRGVGRVRRLALTLVEPGRMRSPRLSACRIPLRRRAAALGDREPVALCDRAVRAAGACEDDPIRMPGLGAGASGSRTMPPGSGSRAPSDAATGGAGSGAGSISGSAGLSDVVAPGSGRGGGAGGASGAGGGWEAPRGGRSESGST